MQLKGGVSTTIADRIKLKREELKLTQAELAVKAGYCDKTAISKFENSGDNITMKQVKRIAEALGVTSSYLMGWEEDSEEKSLIAAYENTTPEVRQAVEILLGYRKPDP
jgi:transcriptional regulator with XRE-family HTH domain